MIKALFLTKESDHFSTKYRVLQYLDLLRDNGIVCTHKRFPRSLFQWGKILKEGGRHDILFIQKRKLNLVELALLRKVAGLRIIYDIDDAVMFSRSRPSSTLPLRRYERMVRRCRLVTVGNSFLQRITKEFTPNVRLIPVGIDLASYSERERPTRSDNAIVIGWSGGPESLPLLESFLPTLETFSRNHPRIVLKVVSRRFPERSSIPMETHYWTEESYADQLASFDVAISPLDDTPQSKGKCAAKLLHYMGAGLPTLSSRLGAHLDIIREGENGFLAATPDEWREKLGILVEDADLRRRVGKAARATIERSYTREKVAALLAKAIRDVASMPG